MPWKLELEFTDANMDVDDLGNGAAFNFGFDIAIQSGDTFTSTLIAREGEKGIEVDMVYLFRTFHDDISSAFQQFQQLAKGVDISLHDCWSEGHGSAFTLHGNNLKRKARLTLGGC